MPGRTILLLVALLVSLTPLSCSDADGSELSACNRVAEGECGKSCSSDGDCAAGLHCASGECFAECVPGDDDCGDGVCDANGRCAWGLGTGGSASSGTSTGGACGDMLAVTIRDFAVAHPDFENEAFKNGAMTLPGIVENDLGADDKPIYAPSGATTETTGPAEFAQWYNDTAGVNQNFSLTLQLTEMTPGEYSYINSAFFPIDDMGFGNEGNPHNYHFTTEIHTSFQYEGGEQFTFDGDDDLWLFINRRLAIDLGGTHPALSFTLDLDAEAANLGITPGNSYRMDIFHAERNTTESNFRVTTTIGCFLPPPE